MSLFKKISFNVRHHLAQPRPMRSLAADVLARTGCYRYVSFRRNGVRLRLRAAGLARLLWAEPGRRLDGEAFLTSFLHPGDTVVDVGSNVGTHALLASRLVGPAGTVVAIEPHPATFAALEENLRLNRVDNVIARRVAAGPEASEVCFSDRRDDDWNRVESTGAIAVPQNTLDEVCAEVGPVALLKIDIEGYELPCLRGAGKVLRRTECVLLEYWNEHTARLGYGLADLVALLGGLGFTGLMVEESGAEVRLRPAPAALDLSGLHHLAFVRVPARLHARLSRPNGAGLTRP
ncbi:MAG TPA: FkbM family methyltransferase [Opitutaceae bacterium]|nr:FkbM family methyltransferase [Opitutaceae bacterium]